MAADWLFFSPLADLFSHQTIEDITSVLTNAKLTIMMNSFDNLPECHKRKIGMVFVSILVEFFDKYDTVYDFFCHWRRRDLP